MKHVDQPVMNGPQKMRLTITKKTLLLRRKNCAKTPKSEPQTGKNMTKNSEIL